jgi:hydroxypyruvate reductase
VNTRRILLELFDRALRAVDGRASVEIALRNFGPGPVAVFAIGKAASAMARGAYAALGEHIEQMFVITKDGHLDPEVARLPFATIVESAHPVPDERSLAAGAELERRISSLGADSAPLFLVSGGSSSLVERLIDGATLDELRALNTRGLAAGWDIATLNAERRKLSRLKGGGVARLLAGRAAMALFISDVPGDEPRLIGSGLLGQHGGNDDAIQRIVVANLGVALGATVDAAHTLGLQFEKREQRIEGAAEETAREFVDALRATAADGLVWGGESTVTLPARAGRGGRNTHLALTAARMLRAGEPLTILAAGTDGTDGPTSDAGAIVDCGTIERAELGGIDVERALREFDSGTALEASQDLVHTGPTGTNVGDLLIGIKTRRGAGDLRDRDAASGRMV